MVNFRFLAGKNCLLISEYSVVGSTVPVGAVSSFSGGVGWIGDSCPVMEEEPRPTPTHLSGPDLPEAIDV